MYKYSLTQVLEEAFLKKLVDKFGNNEIVRFHKLHSYYKVKTEILKRTMEDGKPNNRIAHGFAKYISNMATSYFMGRPIKYTAEDEGYLDCLKDVLDENYIENLNFEVSKESSIKGIAFMLLFINESGKLRIKKCKADEIIPVYSNRLGEFLECAIRIWKDFDIDGNLICQYAEVYDSVNITTFKRANESGNFEWTDQQPHKLDDIPVIVVWNNEEQSSDFEDEIPLIDAYDKSQSDTANDMEYFTDAYLCIAGASDGLALAASGDDMDEDDGRELKTLRRNRILFLDEKGQAEWLVKNINDTAVENFKNRLYKDVFFLSQVPALTDESFSGNLTGVAIKYKLIGLEELAIMKENKFRPAQKKMIKLVTAYINLRMNKNYDPETVKQKYERNFINNNSELIENAAKLEGMTSRETQLNALPNEIVPNAADELERIQEEALNEEGLTNADVTV